jgi:uncharacterized membrane protein (UPF0127 family)
MRPLQHRVLPGGLRLLEAATRAERRRGLGGEPDLDPATALVLKPCRSVHTLTMRFALDLVWLDARGAVVRVDRDVPPGRVRTCLRARAVIEARAGEGARFAAAVAQCPPR